MIGAWSEQPRLVPREPGCAAPGSTYAFPSGRAAILACLRLAGVGTGWVVGMPECVTGCITESVGRWARPVPLRAALGGQSAALGAAIVYEQWGWPLPAEAIDALRDRLAGAPVLIDRVDSADFFAAPRSYGAFEIVSLSKTLGLPAGGMARHGVGGAAVQFCPPPLGSAAPGATRPWLLDHPAVRELFKQSDHVHPAVLRWVDDNCVVACLAMEQRARGAAAQRLLDSGLAAGWPSWMATVLQDGAGPVWAPVLRGSSPEVQWHAVSVLADRWGIAAPVRAFNWTANPLAPCYEPAVALPIHGGVASPGDIIAALEPLVAVSGRGCAKG